MRTLTLLLLLFPMNILAQTVKVIDLETNDILFNRFDQKIYATTPSSAGEYGNSICIIDPMTAEIDTAIFIGSEPNKVALSDNGVMMYVALDGAAAVRQFIVPTLTPSLQFPLGNDPSSGPFYVEDIEILKDRETSIVVSRRNVGISPRHEGVGIYDNELVRPNTTRDHTGSNVIEVVSENFMVGYNNASTEFGLRTMRIDDDGVQEIEVYRNMINGFGTDIYYSNNRIYSTNGKVVDISTETPILLGTFPDALGQVVEDDSEGLICYAYQGSFSDEVLLKRYSRTNFIIVDTIVIDNVLPI